MDRPHGTGDKISADAARRTAQRRSQRAASLARRGAAARRRAALTVALLAISAVSWVVVGISSVAITAAVAPTLLLAGVLVLGRRAVVQGHAADAAWERAQHAPGAAVGGGDLAAAVVGRAHHPSDARTEVIARIRSAEPESAQSGAALAGANPSAGAEHTVASPTSAQPSEPVGATAVAEPGTEAAGWSPVPVPPPVYTTKAAAPRREPIPLVLDEPDVSAATGATTSAGDTELDGDASADLEAARGSAASPVLDLDAILARRRSAG